MNPIKLKIDFDITQKELPLKWPSFFSMGSCFAENQSMRLSRLGFNVKSNPFGILYNPISIEQTLRRIQQDKKYESKDFISSNYYFSLEHHGSFEYESLNAALEQSNLILAKSRGQLTQTDVCIFTLGTSLVYQYDGKTVANCHRLPTQDFEQVQLTYQQVSKRLKLITKYCKTLNPKIHLIFTVSPIRYLRSGIVESNRSKALLVSTIHDLIEYLKDPNISYFPAYEIFIDELRDYRFSKEDLSHPNKQAQDYIWSRFCDTYFSDDTKTIVSSVEKYLNFKNHQPSKLEPHLEQLNDMKKQLLKTYPFLNL